jgi:hypothetical protein
MQRANLPLVGEMSPLATEGGNVERPSVKYLVLQAASAMLSAIAPSRSLAGVRRVVALLRQKHCGEDRRRSDRTVLAMKFGVLLSLAFGLFPGLLHCQPRDCFPDYREMVVE